MERKNIQKTVLGPGRMDEGRGEDEGKKRETVRLAQCCDIGVHNRE